MPTYDITSGLPELPVGLKDSDYNLVLPLYRAISNVAQKVATATNFVQYTDDELQRINPTTALRLDRTNIVTVKAGEPLTYGTLVALSVVDGAIVATKASNITTTGKRALACINTVTGLSLGDFGQAIFMQGLCPGISGSILGQTYYLGVDGQAVASQAVGTIQQVVGVGMGSAGLYLNIGLEITHVVAVSRPTATTLRIHQNDGASYDI